MDGNLTPLQRFFLAFIAFFYVLVNRRFAEEVQLLRARELAALPPAGPAPGPAGKEPATLSPPEPTFEREPEPPPPAQEPTPPPARVEPPSAPPPPAIAAPEPPPPPPAEREPPAPIAPPVPEHAEAFLVLSLLQRDGRLLDFVSESLEGFSDREIGAAARTVHEGCRKVVETYLELEPVLREQEGASVTVEPGFDPASVRLTGNVVGSPPFQGSLRHHGWRVARASFPTPAAGQDVHILAPAEVEL